MTLAQLALSGLLLSAPPPGLSLSPSLRGLLQSGRWDATPKGFRIIALSFLADGCVAEARRHPEKAPAARACVERCADLAARPGKTPPRPHTGDGLWLTHYALILGAADELGSCLDEPAHRAIAQALARRSLADPHRHVASYTQQSHRWPADQVATLASLARYDRAHGQQLHREPLEQWRRYVLAQAMDRTVGLPWSEVTGNLPSSRAPRGCALSWQTRYLQELDPVLAQQWWEAYRAHFLVEQGGMAGFREWPKGRDFGADLDSGPVVAGVGAAASGLGIAAARAMGDDGLAERIERTARLAESLPVGAPHASGLLPDAIRYLGAQLRSER